MRLNPTQIIAGLIAVLLSVVGSFTGMIYAEMRNMNATLSGMGATLAVQTASNTYQDEQLRNLRSEFAALEQECRRRWDK